MGIGDWYARNVLILDLPDGDPFYLVNTPAGLMDENPVGDRGPVAILMFSYTQNRKTFKDFTSHRILRHMHGSLNIDRKN